MKGRAEKDVYKKKERNEIGTPREAFGKGNCLTFGGVRGVD